MGGYTPKSMIMTLSEPPRWGYGLPVYLVFISILLCANKSGAEKPTYRSIVEEAFRDMKEMNITAILDSLQTGYDKRIRPNYGGEHVTVGVTMHILSISSVSEVMMDFTLDFYFRQHWGDPRLSFPILHGLDRLTVGSEYLSRIWVPDTFFANEKKSYFHTATTANEMLRISSEGNILRSMRLTITAACPMFLHYFPMDRQLCTIEIESFGYSMDHIRLSWYAGDKSVAIESKVSLPQFIVKGYNIKTIIASTSTGNYSRLLCEILFIRSMGYYLIQIYIPSSLIVVISWVSFWINRGGPATPARVSLGVTTVLTMTTLMSSTNAALPKVSYVKSIDVFLGTCFVMVFASLLEYAAVGYLGKRIQMRKTRYTNMQQKLGEQMKPPAIDPMQAMRAKSRFQVHDPKMGKEPRGGALLGRPEIEAPLLAPKFPSKALTKNIDKLYGCSPSDIDKYSRIVFPVCFVCFNLMYWIIYLHISYDTSEDLILHKSEN